MKIKGTKCVEIDISDREAKEFVLAYLRKNLNWGENFFTKNGEVYERVEYKSSHSWTEDELRRIATPEDNALYNVIGQIKAL